MSEENVKIVLTADGSQVESKIREVQRRIEAFQRSLQSFNSNLRKMTAGLSVSNPAVENFAKGQDTAMRGLRQRWTFERRINGQRLSEERAVSAEQARQDRARRTVEDRAMRDFSTRMEIQRRTFREQAGMERDAERARASAARELIRLDNYRFGLRQRHEREMARDRARLDRERWSASAREPAPSAARPTAEKRPMTRGDRGVCGPVARKHGHRIG